MQVLKTHEGEEAPLLKELTRAKAFNLKTNVEKSEKEAKKILKIWKPFAEDLEKLQL